MPEISHRGRSMYPSLVVAVVAVLEFRNEDARPSYWLTVSILAGPACSKPTEPVTFCLHLTEIRMCGMTSFVAPLAVLWPERDLVCVARALGARYEARGG